MLSKKYNGLLQLFILLAVTLCAGRELEARNGLAFEVGLKDLPSEIYGNMIRDQEGFLWFSYYGGIGRYDGYEVKYYKPGENSISGPGAFSIVMDADGIIWILTKDNGLNKYDKDTDTFTHYKHDPNNTNSISSNISDGFCPQRMFVDNQNRLLIGTMGGFDIYDKEAGAFKHYVNDPDNKNSLSNNNVTSVIQGKDGVIWVGTTGGGLNRFDEKTGTWTRYRYDAGSDRGPAGDTIWSLLEDREGTLWVGTWDGGISRFDKESETFLHYRHDPDNPSSLGDNKIFYLYEDSAGNIWVCHKASDVAGIEMFDKEQSKFIRYAADPGNPSSISSNLVSTVYEDPETGIFWILNTQHGVLDKYDKESRKFGLHRHDPSNPDSITSSKVLVMLEDPKERLWISVIGALELYDNTTGTLTHLPYEELDPRMGNLTIAMCAGDDNKMWLLSNRGVLTRFDTVSRKAVKQYTHEPGNPAGIMQSTSTGGNIIEDRDNPEILWIGLSGGMEKFNKNTEEFTHFVHDTDDSATITLGTVWSIYDDGNGFLWVSTFGGLNRFDKQTGIFTRFVHDPDNPDSIGFTKQSQVFEDSFGNFWVAGLANGMDLLDRKTGVFQHFNQENGFPAKGINLTVQEDANGHLWIGTTDLGLIKFDIENRKVVSVYTTSDGLQGTNFWRSYKKKDGQMWFGGAFGVNSFYPDEVKNNKAIPPVVLTSFTQGGKDVNLSKAPERLKEVTLGWKDNFFEFQFAALNYTKPAKNRYAYMLEGRDKDWYYCDNNPSGRYTGLAGGTYTLRLKGSNNDGVWNEEGFSLKINVIPPFWKTLWFFGILAIGILCVIGVSIRHLKKLEFEINRRKLAQKALGESEEKYRVLIENSPDLHFRTDVAGRIFFVSQSIHELFGYTVEEVLGLKTAGELYADPEERIAFLTALEQNGSVVDFEAQFKRKDGSIWWGSTNAHTVCGQAGNILGIEGVSRDVTERKQAEAALKESEKRLKFVLDGSQLGFWDWNIETGKVFRSALWAEMLGYTFEEVEFSDKQWIDLQHPDDRAAARQSIQDHLKGRTPVHKIEYRMRSKDGEYRWILDQAKIVSRDPYGKPLRMSGTHTDITDQKRTADEKSKLEIQLQQARKLESVGRLAGGVAHDFNNMLGVIIGHVDLGYDKVETEHPLHAHLEEVRKAAQRSAGLVRQLLTFARKQIIEPKVLDLNETIESMVKMLWRLIGEDIRLSWRPGADLWPVRIDPSHIDQILANLCVNARDAISDVGEIAIETGKSVFDEDYCAAHTGFIPGEYVRLVVSDSGHGMDNETKDQAFEPFFTTKGVGEGTGLGLATVYGAVKQSGGFINIYSEPGEGTTFTIYLPRHMGDAGKVKEVPAKPIVHGNETILLVEDEPAILNMTTTLLERLGYVVLPASSPGEGVRLAEEHVGKINLLMTDVVMPGMNGRDLSKKLTAIQSNLKILFMSGYTANVIAHRGVLDDGVSFIQKPFSKSDLAAKVRQVFDR